MELKDIIREYKNRYQLNNEQIAERFHVSKNTVARWLRGEVRSLQDETAYNISQVLGYDIQTLLQGKAITMHRPILGYAKAGYDLFLDENFLGNEVISPDEYEKGDFFLKVVGDSMINDGIVDGGLVYVKKTECLNNGEIGVFSYDEEVTIKRFFKEDDGYLLKASNTNCQDLFFSFKDAKEKHLKIIGKVLFSKNYM
ncbi:LexA family protein [Massilimicrobiota timonensis]|uniref:LexA family protein n=1 Tax=Massilimicrobiota timonensis TaxID=1776392 RepID=UPI00101D06EC|nr:S24 family peptidase [Massilimicrobiota timonensis]